MKKMTFSFLFVSLIMMSCNNSDEDINSNQVLGATTITATPSISITSIPAEKIDFTLTVLADGDWSISSDSDWITHYPSGGVKNEATRVSVSVSGNNGFDARDGVLTIKSGSKTEQIELHQLAVDNIGLSMNDLTCGAAESSFIVKINSNVAWKASSNSDWIKLSPSSGNYGETEMSVAVSPNSTNETRTGEIVVVAGSSEVKAAVTQYSDNIETPEGYYLVWHDEFNEGTSPGNDWTIEVKPSGWVNNELQNYVKNAVDGKKTIEISNGFLHINCFKGSDGKIYSGRMYANESTGWTYGYFEARINLPSGKGTWPAFWMMPVNVDWNTNPWPKCGEIDIMEEVGVDANKVSSSLHTQNYNHTKNTQKTHEMNLPGAEGEFHVYALEWTEDEIITYVDGKVQLRATKADMGSDHDSWPFHYAFYPILNLAWGGDWGGYRGVDESALPVTMLVDYVRVFQKPE